MLNRRFYSRQTGLIDPANLAFPILLVGLGTVGSWTALVLRKLGCQNLTLVDPDQVDVENIGCQIYRETDIRTSKTLALQAILGELDSQIIICSTIGGRIESSAVEDLQSFPLIINAADSMDTRKYLFQNLRGSQVLIDGRMAGNAIEIYTANQADTVSMGKYSKTLFDSKKAIPAPCGQKAVAYNGFVIAGLIADLVSKFANKEVLPSEVLVDLKNLTMFKTN